MISWNEFNQKHEFEQVVYNLTVQSLALLAKSELGDKTLYAFAFNCDSYSGDISMSLDLESGSREKGYYPPDWTNETVGCDIQEIGALWQKVYEHISEEYQAIIDSIDNDEELDNFSNGYLNTLRIVMVRLENAGAFRNNLNISDDFWTLVTEVDADEEEEERLLNEVRNRR